MGFSKQEYWSVLPFLSPGNLANPGMRPVSPCIAGRCFTTEPPGKPFLTLLLLIWRDVKFKKGSNMWSESHWMLLTKAPCVWSALKDWDKEPSHWKRPWCWERLRAGREGGDRGWDGWMASPTQWTWVWVNSGKYWRTKEPGLLQSVGLQRAGHDLETKLQETY